MRLARLPKFITKLSAFDTFNPITVRAKELKSFFLKVTDYLFDGPVSEHCFQCSVPTAVYVVELERPIILESAVLTFPTHHCNKSFALRISSFSLALHDLSAILSIPLFSFSDCYLSGYVFHRRILSCF